MSEGALERRTGRRDPPGARGIMSVRIRPGHGATVIDVSAGGALIETAVRLLPGAAAELQLETVHRWATLGGRVVRCAVVRLRASSVSYRAAIVFDAPLSEVVDDLGSGQIAPCVETAAQAQVERGPRVDRTRNRG